MIIVTGGAGFIGSALIWKLNENGINDILVVDHLDHGNKWKNLAKRQISRAIHKDDLSDWLATDGQKIKIDAVFHMGASSATTETDADYLMRNNLSYSIDLFRFCADKSVPFIYASSAATYGDGEQGFVDDLGKLPDLRPINPYGLSKQLFDHWVLREEKKPPFWAGLKFFNVYGPQEYHKGAQASVPFHLLPQIKKSEKISLFKSYRDGIADGDQKRDFVYVKDCVDVMWHLFKEEAESGIYNIGTGQARTFADLGRAVFTAMDKKEDISWIEMPENIRGQYQYFTEAELKNLRSNGKYEKTFYSLEDGVADYFKNYLLKEDPYL